MVSAISHRSPTLMRCGILASLCLASLCLALALGSQSNTAYCAEKVPADRAGIDFFETKIRPVLVNKCYACHSQAAASKRKLKGKLLLDSKAALLAGGETGPAIVPGKPAKSLLIKAIRHDSLEMPPKKKLPDRVISDFVKWIEMGAPDPRGGTATSVRALDLKAGRQHWAFRPLANQKPPTVENAVGIRNPVDQFILARLREKKLTPTATADRRTLIRRVYFDLIGLPPSPQQVKQFVNDETDAAYEKLIDQLLKSPHYGEHWARHWLDVARFGESEGSNPEEDRRRTSAYKYRDAVIRSFNEDLPYHEFVSYQLAGVGLKSNSPFARDLAQFVALGTRLQRNTHPNDKKFHILDDMVSATGSAFLGITIGCARCHDHKLDPITSEEYYRLTAVFFDQAKVGGRVGRNNLQVIREPHLLAGGSWQRPVKKVGPGFVQVLMREGNRSERWLSAGEAGSGGAKSNQLSPRQSLVRWMTDVDQGAGGLLARVIVNRLWQHHFGRGLVSTPNDFGHLGARPTHPQLLDWLSGELIRNEWRLKPIHRLIMNSATYKQASSDRWAEVDRDNRWLWHSRTHRLSAEAVRDNILSVSGALKTNMYGPSIDIGTNKRSYTERPDHWRRSIYLMTPRFVTHPVLQVFDPADTFKSQGARTVSTTPSSALFMFNAPFLWKQAELLADRVSKEAGTDPTAQVEHLYEIAFARPPTAVERSLGTEFLKQATPAPTKKAQPILVHYCHAIMGLNEFIYVR